MENENKLRRLIEDEKKQLELFIKMAERTKMPADMIDAQINLYLDKINELIKRINNGK